MIVYKPRVFKDAITVGSMDRHEGETIGRHCWPGRLQVNFEAKEL